MSRDVFKLFWKEEEMLPHGKHAPVPIILRPVAGKNLKGAHFVDKMYKFLSLNICYVIYVLLWIKCWLMWFEILLVFILLKFKKRPNISRIWVVFWNQEHAYDP